MRPLLATGMVVLCSVVGTGVGIRTASLAEPAPSAAAAVAAGPRFYGPYDPEDHVYNFYFTRGVYSGLNRYMLPGGNSWTTDYPKADRQLMTVVRRLTNIDGFPQEHPVELDDPTLRRFPFLYCVEVGHMNLTDSEVKALRNYLLAGGFLMVDDFWGSREWRNFEENMHRVFPQYPIVELPMDHEILHTVYDVKELVQVPNVANGESGGPTYEQDGYVPHLRGIFDNRGRLLVLIDWNSDMGDAWEWAEQAAYPLKYSTYAFRVTVNAIVYSMSH